MIEMIPSSNAKKKLIFDATMMSSIMGCGRFVDYRFNHQLVALGGKSNSLEIGSIIHKGLEYYYKAIINGSSKHDAVQLGMSAAETYVSGCALCTNFTGEGKPECKHEPNEFPGLQNTPPDNEKWTVGWKHVLTTLEEYFEYYKNDSWVPLEVEKVKGIVLYEDDEIRVLWKAKLDLLSDTNNGIFPIDHKTMKQRRNLMSLNNQFIGQCLVCGTNRMIVNKIGFQSSLKPIDKFTREVVVYSQDRLIEWQSEILPFWAYQYLTWVENGIWPPNFDHCETKYGVCPFKEVCESDRNMRGSELQRLFIKGPEWNPQNPTEDV